MDLGELYDTYYAPCLRFARTLTNSHEEAEDICQQAFLRAMAHLPLLAVLSADKRKNWLFTVIRNMRIDAWRKEKRLEQALHSYQQDRSAPEDPLDRELSRWDLQANLSGLSASQQDLIHKRYWLGMSSAQIAAEMNLAPATVRYHLKVAVGKLREIVERKKHEETDR